MTPAIKLLDKRKISYQLREYEARADDKNYGMAAATALEQDTRQVFKTLIVVVDGKQRKPVVAIIPVADQLDLKKLALAAAGRKAVMAEASIAQRATGYVLGGISPLGQRQHLPTFIDSSAKKFPGIFISGGKRGLQLELSCEDLAMLTNATFDNLTRSQAA